MLGIPGVQSKVLTGDIAEEIMAYAKSYDCDLIIMGTHGYKGFERIIFGSIADKVVKNACCPVLTINPYQEECEKNKGLTPCTVQSASVQVPPAHRGRVRLSGAGCRRMARPSHPIMRKGIRKQTDVSPALHGSHTG